ncbi:uncharacterized protein LOC128958561 [Oppia nitens]|uniref:uncharacterized protein LOC128958561 n=1 Tax=Oppia nitens TaxID=1686743 RepID=UPI0023DA1728|nr:uncharacterized protein LOC128958561 [Oppia nitens]
MARTITNMLVSGVTKANKPMCSTDATKRTFLKHSKCGNINIEDKHKCMDVFVGDLRRTETEDKDKKIPYFCCNFWHFKDCIRKSFTSVDTNRCPKESIDAILNLINGYSNDALDLLCGEYDDGSAKCRQLRNSRTTAATTTTTSTSKSTSRKGKSSSSRSMLPSFINIFTNL